MAMEITNGVQAWRRQGRGNRRGEECSCGLLLNCNKLRRHLSLVFRTLCKMDCEVFFRNGEDRVEGHDVGHSEGRSPGVREKDSIIMKVAQLFELNRVKSVSFPFSSSCLYN